MIVCQRGDSPFEESSITHPDFTEIDECKNQPCQNSSTCDDQVNAFKCHCVEGYTGIQCETGD